MANVQLLRQLCNRFSHLHMVGDLGFKPQGVSLVATLGTGHTFVSIGFIMK